MGPPPGFNVYGYSIANPQYIPNYNHPNYGPTFGRGFDLVVGEKVSSFFSSNQNWSKFPNSYGDNSDNSIKGALTGGYENFLVKEIETYEVIFNEDFSDDELSDN